MRSVWIAMLVLALMPNAWASGSGFGLSTQSGLHEEYGEVNIWASVSYPDAPKANLSFGADQVPDIVYDSDAVMTVSFTSDSANWKKARIGLGGRAIEIPIKKNETRGDILTVDIPLDEFRPGLNGIVPVIGQKGSYKAVLTLPIIGDIGRRGVMNEDWGLLRFNLIRPVFDSRLFGPCLEADLSAKEVYLLTFNGGMPVIGQVAKDLVRQLTERRIAAQTAQYIDPAATEAYPVPAEAPPKPPEEWPSADYEPQAQADESFQGGAIQLVELPQFSGSIHYQIVLPEGVSRVKYSLTREGREPNWQEVTLVSSHIRLPVEGGPWVFQVQAIDERGETGPTTVRIIPGTGR